MSPSELEAILKEHLAGVHTELSQLFRGIKVSLDRHLARTEAAIGKVLEAQGTIHADRLAEIEKRLAALEARQ